MNMKQWLAAAAVAFTCFAILPYGVAQESGEASSQPARPFMRADTNGDGAVTFEELSALRPNLRRERFDLLDSNNDGVLTSADASAGRGRARHPGNGGGFLREADANGDRQVTFDELAAVRPQVTRERFARLDRNGDGVLTPADRRGGQGPDGRPRGHGPGYREADTDGDGQVTFEELKARRPQLTRERFDRMDRNGDGALSRADRPEGRGPGGYGHGERRGHGGPGGDRGHMLQKADADKDGKVTFEEFSDFRIEGTRERFDRLDTNNDGALTPEDIRHTARHRPNGDRGRPGPGAARLRAADTNGDGDITYEEALAAIPELRGSMFERMDRNGDGVLNEADRAGPSRPER